MTIKAGVVVGTASVATVCASVSAIGWVFPDGFVSATWLMIVGFAGVFAGMGYLIVSARRQAPERVDGEPARRRISLLRKALVVVAACGVVSGAAGLITTGGWSADPRRDDPACPWRIGTDHGSRNQCVSHARWLQVDAGVERGILGLVTLFGCIECWILTSSTEGDNSGSEPRSGQRVL